MAMSTVSSRVLYLLSSLRKASISKRSACGIVATQRLCPSNIWLVINVSGERYCFQIKLASFPKGDMEASEVMAILFVNMVAYCGAKVVIIGES